MQLHLVQEDTPKQKAPENICLIHIMCKKCYRDTRVLNLRTVAGLAESNSILVFADAYEKAIIQLLNELDAEGWGCRSSHCNGTTQLVAVVHNQITDKQECFSLDSQNELVLKFARLITDRTPISRINLIKYNPVTFASLVVHFGRSRTWRKKLKKKWNDQKKAKSKNTCGSIRGKRIADVRNISHKIERYYITEDRKTGRHETADDSLPKITRSTTELKLQREANGRRIAQLKKELLKLEQEQAEIELTILEHLIDTMLNQSDTSERREIVRERILAQLEEE